MIGCHLCVVRMFSQQKKNPMKKITACLVTVLLLIAFVPIQLKAIAEHRPEAASAVVSPAAAVLLNRLDEIQAMDKSILTTSEKKQLQKEVRAIKQELKQLNRGVYLSVGAIIVIILLLILLL
jgi:peptidoglycan hydrolase CwlO-like protein